MLTCLFVAVPHTVSAKQQPYRHRAREEDSSREQLLANPTFLIDKAQAHGEADWQEEEESKRKLVFARGLWARPEWTLILHLPLS